MIRIVAMFACALVCACVSDEVATDRASRSVEPQRHPEPAELPERPDAGTRDAAVGPVAENTSELSSPYDDCVRGVYAQCSSPSCGQCADCCPEFCGSPAQEVARACGGLSRLPTPPPPASNPCAGAEWCFGRCLCDLCGVVLICEDPDPHGPGSGPACEQCHYLGSPDGALKDMEVYFLTSSDYNFLDDFMLPPE